VEHCINHPEAEAEWRCQDCGKLLCAECVKTITVQYERVEVCRLCGGKCVRLEPPAAAAAEAGPSFLASLPSVFVYPLRGGGPAIIVVTALFVCIATAIAAWIGGILFPYGIIITILVNVVCWGYVALFLFSIIANSAKGDRELPTVPTLDVGSPAESIGMPFGLLIGCGGVSFGAAAAYYFFAGRHADELFWFLAAIGALYFPMGMLAVGVFECIEALSPGPIVKSILRIPLQYLVACVFFYPLAVAAYLPWRYIRFRPHLVASTLKVLVFLYAAAVAFHLLGRLYYTNRHRLRWAGVRTDEPPPPHLNRTEGPQQQG
jgi:hypothetical protein